jgi:hypothetical protein
MVSGCLHRNKGKDRERTARRNEVFLVIVDLFALFLSAFSDDTFRLLCFLDVLQPGASRAGQQMANANAM